MSPGLSVPDICRQNPPLGIGYTICGNQWKTKVTGHCSKLMKKNFKKITAGQETNAFSECGVGGALAPGSLLLVSEHSCSLQSVSLSLSLSSFFLISACCHISICDLIDLWTQTQGLFKTSSNPTYSWVFQDFLQAPGLVLCRCYAVGMWVIGMKGWSSQEESNSSHYSLCITSLNIWWLRPFSTFPILWHCSPCCSSDLCASPTELSRICKEIRNLRMVTQQRAQGALFKHSTMCPRALSFLQLMF
jgi:hypothetical protein